MSWRIKSRKALHTSQDPDKILNSDLVPSVVYFDVIPIQIKISRSIWVNTAGEFIAGIAGSIIREHENDVGVRYTKSLYCTIPGEDD